MLREAIERAVRLLDPPWEREGVPQFTLAVPDARSTFHGGESGWADRPPARLRCPSCGAEFTQRYANDVIRCPTCRFERPPDRFGELELIELTCPECSATLDAGIRHPNVFELPQWAACPGCQYHWEYSHGRTMAGQPLPES